MNSLAQGGWALVFPASVAFVYMYPEHHSSENDDHFHLLSLTSVAQFKTFF